jgi:non-ribosomal peptide synthetase component F
MPTDHLQPSISSDNRARFSFVLTEALSKEMRAFSRCEGVTLYASLLTTFQTLLYSYTGQTDVLLASPMTFCKTQGTHISILQNTLVLRTNLAKNPTFHTLLQRTFEVVSQARAHHEIPYYTQIQQMQPAVAGSKKPSIRVAFSLEGTLPTLLPGWTTSLADVQPAEAEFDLTLTLDSRLEALSGYFEYNTDIFKRSTIGRMQGNWQALVTTIIHNPAQHLSDITFL